MYWLRKLMNGSSDTQMHKNRNTSAVRKDAIIHGVSIHRKAIEAIYSVSVMEHPEFAQWNKEKIRRIIATELQRIDLFERAGAEDRDAHFKIRDEAAKRIGTIWAISGTGTYDAPVTAQDNKALAGKAWARWMDRDRINRSVLLAKRITQVRSGKDRVTNALMLKYTPYIVYNGYDVQNSAFLKAVANGTVMFPMEKVKVISGGLKTTGDQVRAFALPDDPALAGMDIAIVSHAPHLSRIIHMISAHKPFPPGVLPYLFPLATPHYGREEFTFMEVKGLLYYIFLAKDASETPCDYMLHHMHGFPQGSQKEQF